MLTVSSVRFFRKTPSSSINIVQDAWTYSLPSSRVKTFVQFVARYSLRHSAVMLSAVYSNMGAVPFLSFVINCSSASCMISETIEIRRLLPQAGGPTSSMNRLG